VQRGRAGPLLAACGLCAIKAHAHSVGTLEAAEAFASATIISMKPEVTMFKKTLISLALAAAFLPSVASAQNALATEGPWLVRLRALYMINTNDNDPELSLGKIEASDEFFPEIDLTYFINDNLALELVATYPQKHDITLNGTNIGTVKQLPPTLLLQYHFMPNDTFRPYVGVGINYTAFSDENFTIPGVSVSSSSWGAALQGGFDYKIAPRWYVNADVKYVWIDTDVSLNGVRLTTLDINPWLLSIGIGYRF
jgi:outer membrane protein